MEKPKRGLQNNNNFNVSLFLIILLAGMIGGLVLFVVTSPRREAKTPEIYRSELVTRDETFNLEDTGYQLKVFPYSTNQNSRDMLRIELWHTLTNGYEVIVGVCFTQGGTLVGPTNIEDSGRYHDDWEFRIDRSINDAYGQISIPLADSEDIVNPVFNCST